MNEHQYPVLGKQLQKLHQQQVRKRLRACISRGEWPLAWAEMLNPSENALTVQWDIMWQKAAAEKWQRKIPAKGISWEIKEERKITPWKWRRDKKKITTFLDVCVDTCKWLIMAGNTRPAGCTGDTGGPSLCKETRLHHISRPHTLKMLIPKQLPFAELQQALFFLFVLFCFVFRIKYYYLESRGGRVY